MQTQLRTAARPWPGNAAWMVIAAGLLLFGASGAVGPAWGQTTGGETPAAAQPEKPEGH